MNCVGIDLHKKSITLCVVNQERRVLTRRKFYCQEPDRIVAFFKELGEFEAVIEATASYEWLYQLLEPLARRMVLAHPGKLRIIAESTRKSDKLDAQVLAEFLALDMIPPAYRPRPRQREHRALSRQRCYLVQRATSVRNKIRNILSNYNADRQDLFTVPGQTYLQGVALSSADRFVVEQLLLEREMLTQQLHLAEKQLREFAKSAPAAEAEARAVLDSIPQVGPVTIDVVISELGDVRRFRSQKQACAYAGLVPGRRESAGHVKEQGITKAGSRVLRWVLIETAWRLVIHSRRWQTVFEALARRRGRKKAITAVARRLLCVMVSMLQRGQSYRPAAA